MCLVGQGRNGTAQHLSSSSLDTVHRTSGITEEVERHDGKMQQSTSGTVMREMHDSSSSWTDRSLPRRAKAAAKQQPAATEIHAADAPTSQTDQLQPVCQSLAVPDVVVDMRGSAVAQICQAATAAPDAEVAQNGMSFACALILTMSCISLLFLKWPVQDERCQWTSVTAAE